MAGHPQWANFTRLFEAAPFARFVLNSFIIAGGITVAHLIFDPLVGYVFAKMEFPGKRFVFGAMLSTLMLPFFVRMIPLYILTAKMGWLNTYHGLILPFAMSAYGIFLMRQFIRPIPDDLIDAARIDGAGEFRHLPAIVLPQLQPALAVLALLTFVFQFNEFLWPLIVVSRTEMRPITDRADVVQPGVLHPVEPDRHRRGDPFPPEPLLFLFTQRFFVRSHHDVRHEMTRPT